MDAYAQNTGTETTDSPHMNQEQMLNMDERVEERQELREERGGALSENFQNRIINLTQNVTLRLTSAVNRLDNISNRFESRIIKTKGMGSDTSTAETRLSDARIALMQAKTALNSMDSVRSVITSETPRESFRTIRTQIVFVRDQLTLTHGLLQETLVALKETIQNSENLPNSDFNIGTSTLRAE